tara:strand:+ start:514 stop:1233 length:720 start_codon:yes stop_codon:yes gene_type:complete
VVKAIFISVRTGSSRLPNKSMIKIKDKHTIEYVIDAVKKSTQADEIVLCTTENAEDVILGAVAEVNKIKFLYGDENNKLKRWYQAARKFNVDYFVTVDGDDLFYDSRLADLCFNNFEDYDMVNGQGLYNDTYGFKTSTIKSMLDILGNKIAEPHEVVKLFKNKFNIKTPNNIPSILKKQNIRMTLDYKEDLEFFENVINNIKNNFDLDDVLLYLKENKSVIDLNYFREDDWKKNQGVLN